MTVPPWSRLSPRKRGACGSGRRQGAGAELGARGRGAARAGRFRVSARGAGAQRGWERPEPGPGQPWFTALRAHSTAPSCLVPAFPRLTIALAHGAPLSSCSRGSESEQLAQGTQPARAQPRGRGSPELSTALGRFSPHGSPQSVPAGHPRWLYHVRKVEAVGDPAAGWGLRPGHAPR